MTEDELAALEELQRRIGDEVARNGPYANIELLHMQDLLRGQASLIAEVRRLRAALVEIQAVEPDEKPDGTMLGYLAHDADEMAELAREALGVDLPV